MKRFLILISVLFIFSCSEPKYAGQEKAVREQMKRMDGAAAFADKAEIVITEIPAKKVYGILSDKSEQMIANIVPCVSEECNHELHRHTVKKATYDKLKAASGNQMFYQARVFVLEEKDTVVNSYMFFDHENTFIDFTPVLHPQKN